MFERTENLPALLQSFQVCLRHLRHRRRIGAKGAQVHLWIVRIVHIYYWREIEVETVVCQVARISHTFIICIDGIARLTNRSRRRSWPIEVDQAVNSPSLLINRHRHGNTGATDAPTLHLLNESFELWFTLNVVIRGKYQHSTHVVLRNHRTEVERIRWTDELHDHHLPQFLLKRHILDQEIDILCGREWRLPFCASGRSRMMKNILHSSQRILVAVARGSTQYKRPSLR